MKKFLCSVILLPALVWSASAQVFDPSAPMQNDTSARVGRLDNGLTYYLQHNELPAQRADFYLVTNVGAIQETPEQDGLAHFLEHMCLNGTKNLPGKSMLEYFAGIGVEFGRNINAGTGVEQTSYMLTDVPVIRQGILDTALLILHDYSHFVTNDPSEIEAERGVIVEEWRTRRTADWRMHEKELPYLYGDSKYATCTIIGDKHNLETFEPKHLVDFYQTWYRPDMQAVIVVGDIDVDAVEAQLRTLFADIPAASPDAPQKVMPTLPDNPEPVIGIITDPEASTTRIDVYVKTDPVPAPYRQLGLFMLNNLMTDLLFDMLNERLNDISMQSGAPFISAGGGYGGLVVTKDAYRYSITAREGEGVKAFSALALEIEKARRYGFTEAEFERAKANTLRSLEQAADHAGTRRNSQFVYPFIYNFIYAYPYMTPRTEYENAESILSMVNLQMLNQASPMVFTLGQNTIIIYKSVEKEGLTHPAPEEFNAAIARAAAAEIAAPEGETTDEPLISDLSALKGSRIRKDAEGPFGSRLWTLKNGIKVYALPTEYTKDQIVLSIENEGGRSLVSTEDLPSMEANILSVLDQYQGLSSFPATKLQKMLTGRAVNVSTAISELYQGVSANCSPKDLETMFQLIYLAYTDPRFEESEIQPGLDYLANLLPNLEKMPNYQFQREGIGVLYQNNPRREYLSTALFSKFDFAAYAGNMKALFSNAAGSTVTITGDFDPAAMRPLVEKYLGSLPVGKKTPKYIDRKVRYVQGIDEHPFDVKMTTPKVTSAVIYNGEMEYSLQNQVRMDALSYILDLIYTEEIREKEGGTYGVGTSCVLQPAPDNKFLIEISFDTDKDKAGKLVPMARDLFEALATDGPTQSHLDKAKENALKNISENRISNGYWTRALRTLDRYGIDMDTTYEETVNALTADSIRDLVKTVLASGNRVTLIMNPVE